MDPDDRRLWISLGSALENLLVAAEHFGYHPDVAYHPDGTQTDHIAVAFGKAWVGSVGRAGLFDAIRTGQCTRHQFDGHPVLTRGLG